LAAIVDAYTDATEKLKRSHEKLTAEVQRLSQQLDEKNRELARSERLAALGQMAAGVAHEIRNPLAGLQLFASLLERDLSEPARGAPSTRGMTSLDLVRKISAAIRNLDAIVGDILAFAGEAPLKPVPVEISGLVQEVLALVAPELERGGVSLHHPARVALAGASPSRVLADPGQLQRAFLNLIRNAIEAASPGGQVWIQTEAQAGDPPRLRISVADDGPGVPPELAQRIFNPFFTTRPQGTGLGLSIVHRIVEAHGGTVSVASRAGGGAVFTMTIPAADVTASGAPGRVASEEQLWRRSA
jgi:signal transduction histidine kinase